MTHFWKAWRCFFLWKFLLSCRLSLKYYNIPKLCTLPNIQQVGSLIWPSWFHGPFPLTFTKQSKVVPKIWGKLSRLPRRQCLRLKSSMPFKRNLALQNIPLPKQPFKTQPQIENEDVTWSPQYNLSTTRTNKCSALSLQEMELDGRFLILHIVLETCIIQFMHKFNMSFVFHF